MDEEQFNNDLIEQFESMIENNEQHYFDTEQLCEIIGFYLEVGDNDYLLKAIQYAYTLYPENIDIQIKELEFFVQTNQLHRASERIQELQEIVNSDVDYLLAVAKFWSLNGEARKAISFFEKALESEEDLDYIYNCIGNEYLNLDEASLALFYFKKALKVNIHNDYAFYSAMQCFEELHLINESIEFLLQIIDEDPYYEAAWMQLGIQHLAQKNFEEAYKAFDYVTVIDPHSISGYTQKAYSLEQLEDYESAIKEYEETLALDDTAAFTYLRIGECYRKLNKPYKALKSFHQAIQDDPQLDKAWIATSDLYESLGNFQDALYYLDRAIDLDSAVPEYWKRHAYLNIQLGKYEEAANDYYKMVDLEPLNFYNWIGLVETLIVIGDFKRGIQAAKKGLQNFQRAELYYQLSNCYYLDQQEEKGLEAFQKAMELDESLRLEMYKKYPYLKRKTSNQQDNLNS
ncbi:tetratricopeptide repeat protein [Vaginella massiliensis]|uniref:tetratricopeptide repeat protein n=1 Tax=Vaginella massiliensis TaxID=1816680 RepID=UPI000838C830|nr:tetratricopeptide repeat protein [Vaginella massiliensis]